MRSRIQHCRLSLFAHLSSRIFTLLAPLLSRLAHVPLLSLPVRSPLSLPLHPCRPLLCPPPLPPHPPPPGHLDAKLDAPPLPPAHPHRNLLAHHHAHPMPTTTGRDGRRDGGKARRGYGHGYLGFGVHTVLRALIHTVAPFR